MSRSFRCPPQRSTVLLDDLKSHLVPGEYRQEIAHVQWAYGDGYLTWFYMMSYPIMTPDAPKGLLRSTNLKVLEVHDE